MLRVGLQAAYECFVVLHVLRAAAPNLLEVFAPATALDTVRVNAEFLHSDTRRRTASKSQGWRMPDLRFVHSARSYSWTRPPRMSGGAVRWHWSVRWEWTPAARASRAAGPDAVSHRCSARRKHVRRARGVVGRARLQLAGGLSQRSSIATLPRMAEAGTLRSWRSRSPPGHRDPWQVYEQETRSPYLLLTPLVPIDQESSGFR